LDEFSEDREGGRSRGLLTSRAGPPMNGIVVCCVSRNRGDIWQAFAYGLWNSWDVTSN
jgi:hypothetical protein